MPKKSTSGASKKARWSPAQKKARAAATTTKPHRGREVGSKPGAQRSGTQRSGTQRSGTRSSRPATPVTGPTGGREWRPRRDEHRSDDRRDDRGRYERRDERSRYRRDESRDERSRYRRDESRDERGGYRRDDRRDSWRPRDTGRDRFAPTPFEDAEAERLEADSWTKATRTPVSDGPVEVGADNGFAALDLPERLVERLARDGITDPFPIQAATIPDALAGKDVLGRGRTGSGKTLAFGLPLIARLLDLGLRRTPRRPHALVLVPTRELAMQVSDALEPLVHVVGLRHKLVAGGLSYTTQINALNKGVDILIATPGRLNDLLERGAVELDDIRITVLDEADHMAEMGFLAEITTSLDLIPTDGQRLLFSATLDNGIDDLVERYLTDPVVHSTDDATASVETMEHHVLLIDPQHKKLITAEVANRPGRTLVFCRTKLGADRVAGQLREQGVLAAALHGGLSQGARNRVLGAFRDGVLPVLVATDVAARGIHVDDVSVVLQVDPAADHKDYLHRAGRTARAGDRGTVVTLALPHQRRTMERQLRDAGVGISPVKAAPGDAVIAATGATTPSGVPIAAEDFARLIEGPKRHKRGPGGARGPRHPGAGSRGGYRPHHGAGHDERRGNRGERADRADRGDRRYQGRRDGEPLIGRWGDEDRARDRRRPRF
ncbi:MAG TPA: DEAD/DEAH box helicase [Intrasporangium sp.]|uniref:DEAD/DEAH box helicase n=1 Tax=Intrasporangium sp. TaxID=1925024 RepID=UPI002B4A52D6|nr:DEAD/DEAH box helicase [Intrasporangium sp.]HKX65748.1 DEAD/DEAH box helicase [Intrasporangium sp.]